MAMAAVGDGESWAVWGMVLRLLLAVQIPKVMTIPTANPIAIARKTSLRMVWRLTMCLTLVKMITALVCSRMFMEIAYLGHSAFRLKGKLGAVVTDPYDEKIGKFPKDVQADILTISHEHSDHNAFDRVTGVKFKIDGPGEYEIAGISVVGVGSFHDDKNGEERGKNTMYVIEIDGLRIAHLGDLGHKLSQDQLNDLGSVDILMIPVGGTYTVDPKVAVEVTRQIDPWVVIPMHYDQPEIVVPAKLASVDEYLKEMGKTDIAPVSKYAITSASLPTELTVVVMDRK